MYSTINVSFFLGNVILMNFGAEWPKNPFLKKLYRMIVDLTIDQFLLKRCQKKRNK